MKSIRIFLDESGTFESPQDGKDPIIAGFVIDKQLDKKGSPVSLGKVNDFLNETVEKFGMKSISRLHGTECSWSVVLDVMQKIGVLHDLKICCIEYKKNSDTEEERLTRYTRMLYQLITSLIFYTDMVTNDTEEVFIDLAERSNFQITKMHLDAMLITAREEIARSFPKIKIHYQVHSFKTNAQNKMTIENRLRIADFISYALYTNQYDEHINLTYKFEYSKEHLIFRCLCDQFMKNTPSQAIIDYLNNKDIFNEDSYYVKRLDDLLFKAYNRLIQDKYAEMEIEKLCLFSEELVRTSSKNKAVKNLPLAYNVLSKLAKELQKKEEGNTLNSTSKWLYFKICHNLVRYANHTSDYKVYTKYVKKGKSLAFDLKDDIHYYADVTDFENAVGNGFANYYDFENAIECLTNVKKRQEWFLEAFAVGEDVANAPKSPQLGKIMGSLGQNYSFASEQQPPERRNCYLQKAKKLFLEAQYHFSRHRDISVQYSNLLHLSLIENDLQESEKYLSLMSGIDISSYTTIVDGAINNKNTFLLFALVKIFTRKNSSKQKQFLQYFTKYQKIICSLETPYNSHPTQIILNHIAEMKIKNKQLDSFVLRTLNTSLKITNNPKRPALYVMAVKSYILLAQYYFLRKESEKVKENLHKAHEVFNQIMEKKIPGILSEQNGEIIGYFKEKFQNLNNTLKNDNVLSENTFHFLMPKYPFNYE